MKINRLSLMNSLFSILNENNESDSYFVLADYFLNNYKNISNLNIYEVSEACFVSRSSIRRFCKSIGFENFAGLKNEFEKYDDQLTIFQRHYSRSDYRDKLTDEINHMINELNTRMNGAEVNSVIERIHHSRKIVFLVSNIGFSPTLTFQQEMLFLNKVVRIVFEKYESNELIKSLDERDYLITVSANGVLADNTAHIIRKSTAFKSLFTGNTSKKFLDYYDLVYYLSETDRSKEPRSVYMTYGMQYTFDILYSAYMKKFNE